MFEYKCNLVKVVDGDTVDVDIDLGFGVWLRKQRIRLYGIDTPESRTRDKVEKVYGLAAKDFLSNECLGLELELFKYPLYENIKLESEVKEFLFDYGYRIAGWTGYRNSLLASSDYLFLKAKDLDKEQKRVIDYIEKIYSPKGSERIIKKLSWINRCKRGLKKIRNKN